MASAIGSEDSDRNFGDDVDPVLGNRHRHDVERIGWRQTEDHIRRFGLKHLLDICVLCWDVVGLGCGTTCLGVSVADGAECVEVCQLLDDRLIGA